MPKPVQISKFEQEAIANAHTWIAMPGKENRPYETQGEAMTCCEAMVEGTGRRAMLYAVGPVCGTDHRATVAHYSVRQGWQYAVPFE